MTRETQIKWSEHEEKEKMKTSEKQCGDEIHGENEDEGKY
jgi:hypothetical protein